MTPLPFNACPATDEEYQYPFPERVGDTEKLTDDILEALNNGMTLTNLQNSLSQIEIIWDTPPLKTSEGKPLPYLSAFAQDLTGDDVEEIVFKNYKGEAGPLPWTLHIYTCHQGEYTLPFHQSYSHDGNYKFVDLTNNGIPEIIFGSTYIPLRSPILYYFYEWDGEYFRNLIPSSHVSGRSEYPGAYLRNLCDQIDDYNLIFAQIQRISIR